MTPPIRSKPYLDLWGMLHLEAMPGSPRSGLTVERIAQLAVAEAELLSGIGFTGFVIENFGDRPFLPGALEPVTLAAMTRVVAEVRRRLPEAHLVVNCLRNDARGALAVAVAADADAIRVNVHCGAMATDQGILEGTAGQTLRTRRNWGGDGVQIFADVAVKHATPVAERPLAVEASDLRYRGAADALLVTGRATGSIADPGQVAEVKSGAPDAPVIVASGVTPDNAAEWAALVDGAIVGSSLMADGIAGNRVDEARADQFFQAWKQARKQPKQEVDR